MLFARIRAGRDHYAINVAEIVEIVPFARLRSVPGAHAVVAGILNFHGEPTPVIDLTELLAHTPTRALFSSRILLWRDPTRPSGGVGLLAEQVVRVEAIDEASFAEAPVETPDQRIPGRVSESTGERIRWIRPTEILPTGLIESVRESETTPA